MQTKNGQLFLGVDSHHYPVVRHKRTAHGDQMVVLASVLRELVEKFGHEAYRHAPKEWLLKELEALLKEPGE